MNIERLSRDLGFDLETTRGLLSTFVQATESALAGLERAVAAGDAFGAAGAAHHIRGAAANLELVEVVEAAKTVEATARAGVVAGLDRQIAQIRAALAALQAGLSPP
jgi:HPt (histidine-containing phosphotransfer) domain-containing protein